MAKFFNRGQFQRASKRPLTMRELELAEWWGELLDPIRAAVGPLRVTSYVREKGSHADGSAVDVQLVLGTNKRIRAVADLIAAAYLPTGQLFQVIYEHPEPGQFRAHVHLARRQVGRAAPGYLLDLDGTRRYVRADVPNQRLALQDAKGWPVPAVALGSGIALLGLMRTMGVQLPKWVP